MIGLIGLKRPSGDQAECRGGSGCVEGALLRPKAYGSPGPFRPAEIRKRRSSRDVLGAASGELSDLLEDQPKLFIAVSNPAKEGEARIAQLDWAGRDYRPSSALSTTT
jgi:hypothetical protein